MASAIFAMTSGRRPSLTFITHSTTWFMEHLSIGLYDFGSGLRRSLELFKNKIRDLQPFHPDHPDPKLVGQNDLVADLSSTAELHHDVPADRIVLLIFDSHLKFLL